ncbi:Uma2 family endonuclease [Membranicola marinus]|uniref:Uma2 family endonuclease n=1 Tax=Membranihabitans marinus TaxID=1227546 RepID=A0A953HRY2_9BACT|nr:Uma2 family endonuclease [Membranihabitans marinus]MBY5959828.1 Uma2 family endonuclease [Membranihabitans marinus]
METLITQPPPRTIREVFDALPEGTLAQLIESQLVMSPSPTDIHQKILHIISVRIFNFLEKNPVGEVRIAPYDVYLDEQNVFQPDIIFISADSLANIEENGFHGAPDLVVELLSPGTSKYDQNQKKDVYERHGVQEYWIVEPTTKEVQGFFLNDGVFELIVEETGFISSRLLNQEFRF